MRGKGKTEFESVRPLTLMCITSVVLVIWMALILALLSVAGI